MASTKALRDLRAEDVAAQLGGKKVGPNDWRLPDLCDNNSKVGDNPALTIQNGDKGLVWYCHHCQDNTLTGQALARALGLPETSNDRPSSPSPALEATPPRQNAAVTATRSLDSIAADRLVGLLLKTGLCPVCGAGPEDFTIRKELVNGWPEFYCLKCNSDYSKMVKTAVSGSGQRVSFKTIYRGQEGNELPSIRVEPGKKIYGRGSTARGRPSVLLWNLGEDISTFYYYVVVVEGEISAAAAANYGYTGVSWRGGMGKWDLSDWTPVKDIKELVFWPDNSEDSRQDMAKLCISLVEQGLVTMESCSFVVNDGNDRSDIANYSVDKDIEMIEARIPALDYVDAVVLGDPETGEPAPPEELEWWSRRGGEEDLRRMLWHLDRDFAYLWESEGADSPMLATADEVGYWRPLQSGSSLLTALVSQARAATIEYAKLNSEEPIAKATVRNLARSVSQIDQNNIRTNLGVLYHKGNLQGIKVFDVHNWTKTRNDGILTLNGQCVEMSTGTSLEREQVMDMGLLYDSGWSRVKYIPGAYDANNVDAQNIRRLMENLGETINVVTEMIYRMGRRVALIRSKGSGRGKSALINLMKQSLGNLIAIADARDISSRAASRQFLDANNDHTRYRIVIYPEVDKYQWKNINLGNLVRLSGEPYLKMEEKQDRPVTNPRMGNPLLTMGEWLPANWSIQGMFDLHQSEGRLWAYDVEREGADVLPGYIYESTSSEHGKEAFIDLLVRTAMKYEGPPQVYTEAVLGYVTELMTFGDTDGIKPELKTSSEYATARKGVIESLMLNTGSWEDHIELHGIGQKIGGLMESHELGQIPGDDREWANAIRDYFDLPARHRDNKRIRGSNGKWEYPLRYVKFAE